VPVNPGPTPNPLYPHLSSTPFIYSSQSNPLTTPSQQQQQQQQQQQHLQFTPQNPAFHGLNTQSTAQLAQIGMFGGVSNNIMSPHINNAATPEQINTPQVGQLKLATNAQRDSQYSIALDRMGFTGGIPPDDPRSIPTTSGPKKLNNSAHRRSKSPSRHVTTASPGRRLYRLGSTGGERELTQGKSTGDTTGHDTGDSSSRYQSSENFTYTEHESTLDTDLSHISHGRSSTHSLTQAKSITWTPQRQHDVLSNLRKSDRQLDRTNDLQQNQPAQAPPTLLTRALTPKLSGLPVPPRPHHALQSSSSSSSVTVNSSTVFDNPVQRQRAEENEEKRSREPSIEKSDK
jgi:hypothetical protein